MTPMATATNVTFMATPKASDSGLSSAIRKELPGQSAHSKVTGSAKTKAATYSTPAAR